MRSLRTQVVDTGLCIGCGACVGVCPASAGTVALDEVGLYRPTFDEEACTSCGRCELVCPFFVSTPSHRVLAELLFAHSESSAQFDPAAGWVERSFAFSSAEGSSLGASSSGGFVTWLLCEALAAGEITGAWCAFGDGVRSPVEYRLARTADEVRSAAGSKYAPVHLAEVLRATRLLDEIDRVAIVALPCEVAAIRNAAAASPRLDARIALVVGLVCGQGKTAHYPERLVGSAKAPDETLAAVHYRVRDGRSARDYSTQLVLEGAEGSRTVAVRGRALGEAWERREASPYACCFCTDLFADCADVACMDAWLDRFASSPNGTSLVVVRDSSRSGVLRSIDERARIEEVAISEVVASQAGAWADKTAGEAMRESLASRAGLPRASRVPIAGPDVGRAQRLQWAGAFLEVAAERLGPATPHKRTLRAAGALASATGRAVSATAVALRSSKSRSEGRVER